MYFHTDYDSYTSCLCNIDIELNIVQLEVVNSIALVVCKKVYEPPKMREIVLWPSVNLSIPVVVLTGSESIFTEITVFSRITNSRHEMFSRGVNTPPERDLKTCECPSLCERVTCMCGKIGSSSGREYSFRNCNVGPMGKNAGVNQFKFSKTLRQTLGLDT